MKESILSPPANKRIASTVVRFSSKKVKRDSLRNGSGYRGFREFILWLMILNEDRSIDYRWTVGTYDSVLQ